MLDGNEASEDRTASGVDISKTITWKSTQDHPENQNGNRV